MSTRYQFHYTNDDGYKAIHSQRVWEFKVSKPPGDHPLGAYFTTLPPDSRNLANRLRIPRTKLAFAFCFLDNHDLTPLPGGRGAYIFYSPVNYAVEEQRQVVAGTRDDVAEKLQ